MDEILQFDKRGLYCAAGRFHIDPWRPVARALITHGHSDHARPGHGHYLCTEQSAPILRRRLGNISLQTVRYGEPISEGGTTVTFHPAGHVYGSAQVLVEHRGDRAVFSGDYKLEHDLVSEPFEPVRCRMFITECTFGLPIYRWNPQQQIVQQIVEWWRANAAHGCPSVLLAYSLGKAQRVLQALAPYIYVHDSVREMNDAVIEGGATLPPARPLNRTVTVDELSTSCIIAPSAAVSLFESAKLRRSRIASVSGWMAVRGIRRRRGFEKGFAMSDHADWNGLCAAVAATGAEKVIATHGYTDTFARYLRERGIDASTSAGAYFGDEESAPQPDDSEGEE